MTRTEPVSDALASMLSTCATSRVWAEQNEGPYHRDAQTYRRRIVEDREGLPLQLGLRLADNGDSPIVGASVEVWQCDALGRYSGFPPPDDAVVLTEATAPQGQYLSDQTFLRGRQLTDGAGMVEFRTIYPGWYPGRTVHIHLMVDTGVATLTSQLYFADDLNEQILALEPYARRLGRDTTNETDEIFSIGGEPAVVDVVRVERGYRAGLRLTVPPTAKP